MWSVWAIPAGLVLFVASCTGFIGPAADLVDPMSHCPVDAKNLEDLPFPVLVVKGDEAWVERPSNPHSAGPPPPGASYLIPLDRTREIERYLRDHDTVHRKSGWVLNVTSVSANRQNVELFLMGDGYWGGAYEATATTITPLYRKVAGPSFAIVFGSVALMMNVSAWAVVLGGAWLYRRRRYAAQLRHAPDGGRAIDSGIGSQPT